MGVKGRRSELAEFNRAPAITKEAFWAEVRRRNDRGREIDRAVEMLHRVRPRGHYRPLRWDQRWRDRAYRDRAIEERGRLVDTRFDEQKARLLAIPSIDYAERLMPEAERRGRFIACPAHDERTPSCHLGDDPRWHCFGCDAGGSIYDFAGVLWDLPRFGADFRRIHDRLVEVFG